MMPTIKKLNERAKILSQLKKGPRITSLAPHFEAIAAGLKQVPSKPPQGNSSLFNGDSSTFYFCRALESKTEIFFKHFFASIPYSLEEFARVGTAVCEYASERSKPLTFYEAGGSNGALSRTLSTLTRGHIQTLCSTATGANKAQFYREGIIPGSYFHHGPFFDITLEFLNSNSRYSAFHKGFDIIYEGCTFQFYGANRAAEFKYISQVLKEDGILVLIEKMAHEDINEYRRREQIKDNLFKAQFFNDEQIVDKKVTMLHTMEEGMVTIDELADAIRANFKYGIITWNSTNFYTIIVSNSKTNIKKFISKLIAPCVPPHFCSEQTLPKLLVGPQDLVIDFRSPSDNNFLTQLYQ